MFERYLLASDKNRILKHFNVVDERGMDNYSTSYNISVNDTCSVITDHKSMEFRKFQFGITMEDDKTIPFVRAEGNRNKNDNPNYSGSKAIFLQPEYRNLIRNQRCLVPADAFITGTNHHPYLVFLRNKKRPFSFAAIYQIVTMPDSKEKIYKFSVITITANSMIRDLGFKRMPVILKPEDENRWLRPSLSLSNVLYKLRSYPTEQMNAYPISARIKDDKLNDISLIKPTGNKLFVEENTPLRYIRKRKIDYSDKDKITFAERLRQEE